MTCFAVIVSSVVPVDLDLVAVRRLAGEAAAAVEERDLVLLEEIEDAVVVLFDDLVLALQHLRDVDRQALDPDAVLRELVAGVLVVLRRLQQRLGRNAADVGARAARRGLAVRGLPFVDARDAESPSCAARIAAM